MKIVNTDDLIKKLVNLDQEGFEVSIRIGILSMTRAIYYKNGFVYIFSMEEKFLFLKENRISLEDFKKIYEKRLWRIDQIIS